MTQRALLVGINKYRIPGSELNGCVNDVTNVRDILLKYFGFDVNDIRMVVDDRATKANIMKRLGWLVADAKAGDRSCFTSRGMAPRSGTGMATSSRINLTRSSAPMTWTGMGGIL